MKRFDERIKEAEEQLRRVKAIGHVYEQILHQFNCEYTEYVEDKDTGELVKDENDEYIRIEKETADWSFDYDDDYFNLCKEVFKEVLAKVEAMK